MSTYKIGCPHCAQHLECDESYVGMKINCPSCQKEMVIPSLGAVAGAAASPPPRPIAVVTPAPAAPAPAPPSGSPRLAVRPAQPTAPAPVAPAPVAPVAAAPLPMPRPITPLPAQDAPGKGKLVLKVAIAVLIAAPLLYFAFQWAGKTQNKFNEARAKDDDPGVLGGQVSHIMELNQVLDETDPNKFSRFPDDGKAGPGGRSRKARSAAVGGAMDPDELPVIKPTWTLDLNAAQIPDGKACGSISKQEFVAENSWLLTGSAMPTLRFSWPAFRESDLDLFVNLRMKAGQGLENSTWTVAADQKGGDIPQVVMRWKVAGTPQQKAYTTGFVVKLEIGKRTEAGLPGKIYVALPDEEKSVVAGRFNAYIRVVSAAQGRNRPDNNTGMMDE